MGEVLVFLIGGVVAYCYHKFSVERLKEEMTAKLYKKVEEERKNFLNSLPFSEMFEIECDVCGRIFHIPVKDVASKRVSVVFEVERESSRKYGKGYRVICEDCEMNLIEKGELSPDRNESVDVRTYLQCPLSGRPSGVILFLSDFFFFAPPKDNKETENLIRVAKKLYQNCFCLPKKEEF